MPDRRALAQRKRDATRIAERRTRVAELYVRKSMPVRKIAAIEGVSATTIHKDIDALVDDWKSRAMDDIEVHAARQLELLRDLLEDISARLESATPAQAVKLLGEKRKTIKDITTLLGVEAAKKIDVTSGGRSLATRYAVNIGRPEQVKLTNPGADKDDDDDNIIDVEAEPIDADSDDTGDDGDQVSDAGSGKGKGKRRQVARFYGPENEDEGVHVMNCRELLPTDGEVVQVIDEYGAERSATFDGERFTLSNGKPILRPEFWYRDVD